MTDINTNTNIEETQVMSRKVPILRWTHICIPLLFIWMISMVDKTNISILLANSEFLKDVDLINKPVLSGILMSSTLWAYGISMFFWGIATDYIGAKRVIVIGALMCVLAMILGGLAQSYNLLLISRILLGAGEGFLFPASISLTSRWFPLNERARAQTIWFSGNSIGPAVGIPLIVYVIVQYDWRLSFYILALLTLVWIPIVYYLMSNTPDSHSKVTPQELDYITKSKIPEKTHYDKNANTTFSKLIKDYKFLFLIIAYGGQVVVFWGIMSWLPSFLKHAKNFTFNKSGLVTALSYLLAVAVSLLFAYVSDRYMKRAIIAVISWLLTGVMLIIVAFSSNPILVTITPMLIVSALAVSGPLTLTMMHNVASSKIIGRAAGVLGFSQILSGVGPVVVGFFVGASGWTAGIMFLVVCTVISSVLVGFLIPQKY